MNHRTYLAQAFLAPWDMNPTIGGTLLAQLYAAAGGADASDRGEGGDQRVAAAPQVTMIPTEARELTPAELAAAETADDEFLTPSEAVSAGIRRKAGAVAVVPVSGPIFTRENWFTRVLGLTSYEGLIRTIRALTDNGDVKATVLRFDSPGGMSYGGQEAAAELMRLRDAKPIVSMIDPAAHSAAYHLAAATSEIAITPSGSTASIGTWAMHQNVEGMLERMGIAVEMFRSPERKAEGGPWEPMTDEARAQIDLEVAELAAAFYADVARGRGVSLKTAQETFGRGSTMNARQALAVGLVDRIATFEETLARLGASDVATSESVSSGRNEQPGGRPGGDDDDDDDGLEPAASSPPSPSVDTRRRRARAAAQQAIIG